MCKSLEFPATFQPKNRYLYTMLSYHDSAQLITLPAFITFQAGKRTIQ